MKENEVVLGVDIEVTNNKIGLVTKEGEVIKESSCKTGAKEPFEKFVTEFEKQAKDLLQQAGKEYKFIAIGIGAPNANYKSGCMEYPPNFRWGDAIPVVESVKQTFNVPVSFTNDANAAAIGELEFGAGKGMKNFVVLTLGTGLGSGIIL